MQAYVQTKRRREDGTLDSYATISVDVKETKTPGKGRTQSGYGRALPTPYLVRFNGRWRRVKAICFSNCATLYIGRAYDECLTVDVDG